ncbi:Hsp90 cochaperone [Saccharomycopsis crataegensis]|uniref:Hsp90 cochaperone n=1 Tax=Saccharomycopsis crataegensis TaxID=43959 RepID=A0AAV5QKT6_9ASCO|nr:Hsp90 cochaperone [Saccharomycopsis crataegensis]
MSTADELKALGNKAFSGKDFATAVQYFTKAINVSSTPNHVLYSNRSACYTSMREYSKALSDAEECVKINPTWAKGYNRVAAAELGLNKLDDADAAYKKALSLDPANAMAKEGLKQVESTRSVGANATSPLADPNLIGKLMTNPKTRNHMSDPTFVAKIQRMMSSNDPSRLDPQEMLSDPRMMDVMSVILGFDIPSAASSAPASETTPEQQTTPVAKDDDPKESIPEEDVEMMEEPEEDTRAKADKIKAEANTLYKQRKFDEAIELYNKAYETHEDITYLNNRAAAEFEKGDYDVAIKTCETAIDKGREVRADYKVIAKSFARIGNCYLKKDDLKLAIQFFDKSLTEHRNADVLTKLRNAEKLLKKKEIEEYINPEKAEEARLEGRDYFTKGDWPNAVKAYGEMIKRAPEDARGYSNRAAAYIKLMSFPEAVKDCDVAIAKDPNFVKAFIRKATAQLTMREFAACIATLDAAKEVDAKHNDSKSAYEISQIYSKAMSQRFAPLDGETEEQTRERLSRDPEVQGILQDPVMQNILQQASNNPAALQEHMKNPEIFKKINILIGAGIIRTA